MGRPKPTVAPGEKDSSSQHKTGSQGSGGVWDNDAVRHSSVTVKPHFQPLGGLRSVAHYAAYLRSSKGSGAPGEVG
jgi:hypothetical protein